jgi:hypothetical protein
MSTPYLPQQLVTLPYVSLLQFYHAAVRRASFFSPRFFLGPGAAQTHSLPLNKLNTGVWGVQLFRDNSFPRTTQKRRIHLIKRNLRSP